MPCDTNNDASDCVSNAPASFCHEEDVYNLLMNREYNHQTKQWADLESIENYFYELENSEDECNDEDDEYEMEDESDENVERVEGKLFQRMVFHSVLGKTTDFGYLDPCDEYFVREWTNDYEWGRVEEVEEVNIGLFYNYSNEFVRKKNFIQAELKDHLLKVKIPTAENDISLKYDLMRLIGEVQDEVYEISNMKVPYQKETLKNYKYNQNYSEFVNNHVIVSVFDFLDTSFLLKTCSKVSPGWHKMLFYNSQVQNHIFRNRTLNFFNRHDKSNDLGRLNEFYNLNWLETYLMSGMFIFEIFKEEISNQLDLCLKHTLENDKFFYIILKLDPISHLLDDLGENHPFIQRLKLLQPKRVLFSMNTLSKVKRMVFQRGGITHLLSMESCGPLDSKRVMERMLFTKCEIPIENSFSVDFKKGIYLYSDYLKELSTRLYSFKIPSHKTDTELKWSANCMCEMRAKAQYFIKNILPSHPLTKPSVCDDILIGLHLLLLDNIYCKMDFLNNIPNINFGELLENRKRNDLLNVTTLLPEHFQVNLLEMMLHEPIPFEFTSNALLPFNQSSNLLEFITEHVIELSETYQERSFNECIDKDIGDYLKFIKTIHIKPFTPKKNVDLLFHFHMLHPNNYFQDCLKVAKSVKNHKFSFSQAELVQ